MSLAKELMGAGTPDLVAKMLGLNPVAAVTAAGTTGANATVMKAAQNVVNMTATGSDGVRFASDVPLLTPYFLINNSASTGKIYTHTGGNWSGGTTDAGLSITTFTGCMVMRITTTEWLCIYSAL